MFRFISTLNQPTPYYNKLLLYLYFHSKGIIIIVLEYTTTIIIIVYIIIQVFQKCILSFISDRQKTQSPLREVSLRTVRKSGGQVCFMLIFDQFGHISRKKLQKDLVFSFSRLGFSFIHIQGGEISGGRGQDWRNIYIHNTKPT